MKLVTDLLLSETSIESCFSLCPNSRHLFVIGPSSNQVGGVTSYPSDYKIIKYFHESPLGNNAIADCDLKTGIFPLNDDRKRNTEFCFDNNSISQVSSRNSDCRLVYIDYLYVNGRDNPPVYPIFSIILIFTAFFIVVKNFKFRTKLLD